MCTGRLLCPSLRCSACRLFCSFVYLFLYFGCLDSDLNPGPSAQSADALPTELPTHSASVSSFKPGENDKEALKKTVWSQPASRTYHPACSPAPQVLGRRSHPVHLCPGCCRARVGRRPCTQFLRPEASARRRQCSFSCYENLRQRKQKSFGLESSELQPSPADILSPAGRPVGAQAAPWVSAETPGAGGAPSALAPRTALSPSPGPHGSLAFEKGLSLCSDSLPTPAAPQLHFLSCFPGKLTAAPRGGQEARTGPCLLSAAEPEGTLFLLACALEEVASVDIQPPDLAPPRVLSATHQPLQGEPGPGDATASRRKWPARASHFSKVPLPGVFQGLPMTDTVGVGGAKTAAARGESQLRHRPLAAM